MKVPGMTVIDCSRVPDSIRRAAILAAASFAFEAVADDPQPNTGIILDDLSGLLDADDTEVAELAASSPLNFALPIFLIILTDSNLRYIRSEAREENPVNPCGWFIAAMILGLVLGGFLFCSLYPKFFPLDLRAIYEGWFPFVIRSIALSSLGVCARLIGETVSWDEESPRDTKTKVIPFADREATE